MSTLFKTIVLLAIFTRISSASAQFREQQEIDSLLQIVESGVDESAKTGPMARLSFLYFAGGDSLTSEKYLREATTLAQAQNDGKYKIRVLIQELKTCTAARPRRIKRAYEIVGELYRLIGSTGDRLSKAQAYDCIAAAKQVLEQDYDNKDYYQAVGIAEKLSSNDREARQIIFNMQYARIQRIIASEGYGSKALDYQVKLATETARDTGDKTNICCMMTVHLEQMLNADYPDGKAIETEAGRLLDFIGNNVIATAPYNAAIERLILCSLSFPESVDMTKIEEAAEKLQYASTGDKILQRDISKTLMTLAYAQGQCGEAINRTWDLIRVDSLSENPAKLLAVDYSALAVLYDEVKDQGRRADALDKSLKYYRQAYNERAQEQRLISEIRYNTQKEAAQRRQMGYILTGVMVITVVIGFAVIMYQRKAAAEKALLELALENAEQKEKIMEMEIQSIQKENMAAKLRIEQKNKLIETIVQIVSEIDNSELRRLIEKEKIMDRNFNNNSRIFIESDPEFFRKLQERAAPEVLTPLNLRYCAYLLTGMGSKEIMELLNVSENTFWINKKRLRQKLKLPKGESLESFLHNLSLPPHANNGGVES
ncbi:MAG: LuxR family transcriptional regulator [Dysgonamonadaceae bacterium]|jgi:DNA-binding CsgD family transcriptional regulator|nr:LuxR family transcriptional regulator [Dysgonamonadaceae bacterium]